MISLRTPLAGLAILLLATSLSFSQSSSEISFQGRLTDSGGTPITNASQSITFAFYKGSTKVWEETQSVNVVDGLYNVLLGSVVPIDTVRFDDPIDLGIKVGADPEMSPRVPLAAAATARSLPGLYTYFAGSPLGASYNLVGSVNSVSPGVGGVVALGGTSVFYNRVEANYATIAGGISNYAAGVQSTVVGGSSNHALGESSAVVGGFANEANGKLSTVVGGQHNVARGLASFAGGSLAHANHEGSFVWGDGSWDGFYDTLSTSNENQFIVRAVNGFGLNKTPTGKGFHLKQSGISHEYGIRFEYWLDGDYWDTWIDGANDYNFAYNNTLKGYIQDSDGAYVMTSDATLKEDVRPFDSALSGVLQLHPSTYRFKATPTESKPSIGFLAQEVQPLFPEVVSEKDGLLGINYAGLSVVAIKAIQELYAIVQQQQARLERQEAELAQLRQAASAR